MRSPALAVPVCLLFALACSESPTSSKSLLPGSSSLIIVPTGTLDQNVIQILTLFPKGLETAATTRWGNVKSKFAAGLSDPAQMKIAKQMAFELSDWVNKKAPDMDAPPNGETKVSASARAVLYMLMYIYNGPTTTVPPYSPAADAIVGLVTPGAPATVVTPSKHAGVSFQAGSVAENTVIVVSQNLTPFPDNCSGPLRTLLCQYPMFYSFEAFPHVKLLKSALFAICHVNTDEDPRHPLADHERFRLAHDKPANPADYTQGSTIRDQNGESIEILPVGGSQTFVTCPPETIQSVSAAGTSDGLFTRFARAVGKALTPKPAYAIDQGVGFLSDFFSNFNNVDPDGRPDRAVQALTVTPVCGPTDCLVHPGSHLTVNYTVANTGTAATGDGVPGIIRLVQPAIEGPPTEFLIGSFGLAQVVPGSSVAFTRDVVIPVDLPAGDYSVLVTVGIGFFPEIPPDANNNASVPVTVTNAVVDLNGLAIGAFNDFQIAYHGNGVAENLTEGQVNFSGLLSDEFSFAETFPTRLEIDRRSIAADNASVRTAFRNIQRARATLANAAASFAVGAPISSGHADLVSFNGFAEVLLAENWCSGVPTSSFSPAGGVVYGSQQSTTALLQSAVTKFDNAIAIATATEGGIASLNLARVGKARALLDLNDAAGAAAAVQTVPTDFAYGTGANDVHTNGVYQFQNVQRRWTVANSKGGNGLPYRSDGDPRVAFEASGFGFDGVTPFHIQSKYPGLASSVPIALGLEARLIEAEAALRTGNLAGFISKINEVRVFYDLTPFIPPESGVTARNILFKERAYTLWLTSHRLGDLRRIVRQYNVGPSTVFPTGAHPKGGLYGTDVNFPIPVDAAFNPTGLVCLDRNP